MNRKFTFLSILAFACVGTTTFGQAPGGVTAGVKAWFKADAGATVSGSGAITAWANQVTNANLPTLVPTGGATTVVSNNGVPFNFNTFLQHNAGGMYLANSVTNADVLAAGAGSMMGVGTAPDQLMGLAGNSASSPFDANRANSGTRGAKTEFGNPTTGTGSVNYGSGTVLNTGNANIFGMRAAVGATPAQQNTYNGIMATGSAATRPSGSYRFAIGSYPGYFYGTNKSAEVVCHNRQLTSNEFNRVQSYFAVKYGITLGSTTSLFDYLSSNSTTIWTGDAIYQNNITSIGRDDSSALVQKQSKAVTTGSKVYIYNDNTGGTFPAMNVNNTTVFTADQSFVLFGDNSGDTIIHVCAMGGHVVRIGRIWKMVKTGTVGNVTIAFDAASLPAGLTNLLVSTNNTFPAGSTTLIPLATSGTLKYAVMPAANTYFSFSADSLNISTNVAKITCQSITGGSITTTVTGGFAPLSYSWNTNPAQTTASISNVPAGNYTLTVTQASGCIDTQHVTMSNEVITLTATLNKTDVKCSGDDNGTITVINTNGTPVYSYSLNNQSTFGTNNHFQHLSEGLYTVYLKDVNGCTGKDTISIFQPEPLSLSLTHADDYCEISSAANGNADIVLTGGTIPYSVTLNGGFIAPSLQVTNLPEAHYTYAVTDKNGCQIQDTFSIVHVPCCFVFVPNAFTPNFDGKNDVFKIESTGRIDLNRMVIFNRYGQMVFSTYDLGKGWDGTMNGTPVDVGTYFYDIQYTCNSIHGPKSTQLKGDITLIR
jgi:gliding motility-associated-like protein